MVDKVTQRRAYSFWILTFGIIAFGVIQSLARAHYSLNIDEPYTANIIHQPLEQVLAAHQNLGYEITYHLILKLWSLIFGESEFALRNFSLLCYALTILIVILTTRRLAGTQASLIAGFLMATSSRIGLAHALNARPYALLVLQIALAQLIFLELIASGKQSTTRRSILPALVFLLNIVGLMNHPIYGFFMLACVLASITISLRVFALISVCNGAALAFYLLLWGHDLYTWFFVFTASSSLPEMGLNVIHSIVARLWGREILGIEMAALIGFYCLSAAILHRKHTQHFFAHVHFRTTSLLLICIVLIPLLLGHVVSIFHPQRLPIIWLPTVTLLLGSWMSKINHRWLTGVILGIIGTSSLLYTFQISAYPDPFQTRASVQQIIDQAACNDIFILGGLSFSEVEYYLRQHDLSDCIIRLTFPSSTFNHPGWIDIFGLLEQPSLLENEARWLTHWLRESQSKRVWLFQQTGASLGHEITLILKQQLHQAFELDKTIGVHGSFFDSVALYVID